MTEQSLRNTVGLYLIVANLLVIGLVVSLFFLGGFLFDEVTTTVALIVPMFSVYTAAIIKSIIHNRTNIKDESKIVSMPFVFISWVFPVLFTVYLSALVLMKAYNVGFTTFDQFKNMLVGSETIFGVYLGLVVGSMFDLGKQKHNVPIVRTLENQVLTPDEDSN